MSGLDLNKIKKLQNFDKNCPKEENTHSIKEFMLNPKGLLTKKDSAGFAQGKKFEPKCVKNLPQSGYQA